jgi:hypothetical protein
MHGTAKNVKLKTMAALVVALLGRSAYAQDGSSVVVLPSQEQLAFCHPHGDQVCVRGRLEYRECLPRAWQPSKGLEDQCLIGADAYKPIRRARVEIWADSRLVRQTETDNHGDFEVTIAPGTDVNVVVVASGPAGQVNWRDNDLTWFWKDLERHQPGPGGSRLTYNWRAERDDARHFNALDVILRGLEYAMEQTSTSEADAEATFHKVSVIPRSAGIGGATLPVGLASHIWLGWDDDVFHDSVILHEYAHHLQRMNGSYAAWPALHNGCHATADLGVCGARARRLFTCGAVDQDWDGACWVNSDEYAWFEGFPTFFAHAVGVWDDDHGFPTLTRLERRVTFRPDTCPCPLVATPHFTGRSTLITPTAIEDYVFNVLLDLANGSGSVAGKRRTDGAIFQVWWRDLRDRLPTIHQFRDGWNARFPGDVTLSDLLVRYGM